MKVQPLNISWEAIKAWHVAQHSKDIIAAFELGDLILNAVINSGLTEYEVENRIIAYLGEGVAYSTGTYYRACKLARVFSKAQRAVLIKSGISVERASVLSGSQYDGEKRVKIVARIKSGELKKWTAIRGKREDEHLAKTATLRHGIDNVGDVIGIQVRNRGEFQRDLMFDGLRALISQVPQDILVEQLNIAVADCRKRGRDVREFRV